MALSIQSLSSLIPKLITAIEDSILTVGVIKALPVKTAKTVGAALGVAPSSTLFALLDLTDEVIGIAGPPPAA